MNFITLNGIRSDSVKGLLISELPPVVKPQQRTEIEEIDGRDGDIVTKLGYSAYDRTMLIGLHGDFDIDDVIRFFDSEGEAVFSNEPDKLYKYQILDDIEFERLIRFRKAKVRFHVQPFKYSAVERIKTINAETEDSFRVLNSGNTVARPRITITPAATRAMPCCASSSWPFRAPSCWSPMIGPCCGSFAPGSGTWRTERSRISPGAMTPLWRSGNGSGSGPPLSMNSTGRNRSG
jgi:hypothetical protein